MRIASLLPSTTEIVARLGHADDLVGRSHECDEPASVVDLPVLSRPRKEPVGTSAEIHERVEAMLHPDQARPPRDAWPTVPSSDEGGPATRLGEVLSIYEVDPEALREADPDVVITQDLCRVCAVDESEVAAAVTTHLDHDVDLVTCSPMTLAAVLDDVTRIAAAIGDEPAGERLRAELRAGFDAVRDANPPTGQRVAILEWADPLMGCGNWAPELVELAGGEPVLAHPGAHTPFTDIDALREADPDVVVVGPCGYDLARATLELPVLERLDGWTDLRAVRDGRVAVLDGSAYLNRPGPRLVDTARYLGDMLAGRASSPGAWGWAHELVATA